MNQDTGYSECGENSHRESIWQQRQDAARLIQQQRDSIASRIRTILGGNARKLTDTEDVLSTAMRRIDEAIVCRRINATTDTQFYAFMHGVIERAILEKSRASNRARDREQVVQRIRGGIAEPFMEKDILVKEDIERIGRVISDPIDREIVLLKGRDLTFNLIAELMGMEAAAVRQRWSRMRTKVQKMIMEELCDE